MAAVAFSSSSPLLRIRGPFSLLRTNKIALKSFNQRLYNSTLSSNQTNDVNPTPTKTLASVLADSIKASGPVSVSTYMRTCLLDPEQGYYASANDPSTSSLEQGGRDVLGARGDFITSPEISQVFGELLAIFFIARWQNVTPEGETRLIELGPGKGTLLADMIRTFSQFPAFFDTIKSIHLVETSTGLMDLQHDAIKSALEQAGKVIVGADKETMEPNEVRVEWFPIADSVPILSDQWSMVVAHEFFDALPTHIFERSTDGFREVLVDVERKSQGQSGITVLKPGDFDSFKTSAKSDQKEEKFRYVLSSTPTPWSVLLAARNPRFQVLQPGQRVEVSPESWATARKIGELVSGRKAKEGKAEEESEEKRLKRESLEAERSQTKSKGGVGLIIDYGDEKAFGGSFRAFKSHKIVDPLESPGKADLTCNVDFAYLKNALSMTDSRSIGPMFQSHFLQSLGIEHRVNALTKNAKDPKRAKEIEESAKRLIDQTGMGAQYKVLGICAEKQDGSAEEGENKSDCYPFEM